MFAPETKILVIDDFATMRKIVKKILTEIGFRAIEEADDGKTAWPKLELAVTANEPFQLVISDWNMPGLTGIDLLKTCRNDPRFKDLPFMLVTAESETKNVKEAVLAGVSEYVVKPFNAVTLKAKLENVYKRHTSKAA